jgi:HemY protein
MRLWSFIIVLALATGLGVIISQDPGYALFSYGHWTVEMPLWLSAFLIIFIIALSLFSIWFIKTLFSGSDKVKLWWKKHQENTARLQTYKGFLALAEGRWKNAEHYLIQSASHSDTPLINYLAAAEAAEEGNSPERRDRYLQLALDVGAGSDMAVRLTQAQLQFKHGELEESVRNLQRLHIDAPKHPKVLRLLCTLYEAMLDWPALYTLLPECRKTQVLSKEALTRLEKKIYPALLPTYAGKGLKALLTFWQQSPGSIQSDPTIVGDYVKLLAQHSANNEVEAILRTTLKKTYHQSLVHLYGVTIGSAPKKQLTFAESLLPAHFKDPSLLLTLGRLCVTNQLWGKARDYLEKSLNLMPTPETYAELGSLMEYLDLKEKRNEYYKKGLLLATQNPAHVITETQTNQLCLSNKAVL